MKTLKRTVRRSPRLGAGLMAVALAGGCGTEPPVPASMTISPASATLLRLDESFQLTATVLDQDGRTISTGVTVHWISEDESVVTVDAAGLVKAVGEGVALVSATVAGLEGSSSTVKVDLQRGVLLKIYEATGGSHWRRNRFWGTDEPLGSWWGVTTDTAGSVVELSLVDNELTGVIPAEIGELESLVSLSLPYNELTGPIPPEMGDLRALRSLYLYGNELTGPIPPELKNLTELENLSLTWNRLSGPIPPELGDLETLRTLTLDGNMLTGPIPSELANLTELGTLNLRQNELTGPIPPELGSVRGLYFLDISGNALTGTIPPELGDPTELHRLDLSRNALTGTVPPELGKLARLTHLYLSGNALTGAVPPELGDLRSLGYLAIDNTTLSGRLPMELTDLRLGRFYWHDTDLCSPPDEEFQEWLAKIFGRKGMGKCGS